MLQKLLEEYAILNDAAYQIRESLTEEEIKQAEYESGLWLNTDFKSLKLTNKELRDAYIKQQMGQYISKIGHLKNDLKYTEGELDLCKKKIHIISELGIDLNDSEPESKTKE